MRSAFDRLCDKDPVIRRFRGIKKILRKRGLYKNSYHERGCICTCCIEDTLEKFLKKDKKNAQVLDL